MGKKQQQHLEPGLAAFYSFVALLFPPLAVGLADGCTGNVALNTLLWILGVIPGMIHAWWVIAIRVRGPIGPPTALNHQAHYQQQQQQQGQAANAYYDAGRLESQLEATIIGPMKAGRMPEGATIHIAPAGSSNAPPGYAYHASQPETRQQRITG